MNLITHDRLPPDTVWSESLLRAEEAGASAAQPAARRVPRAGCASPAEPRLGLTPVLQLLAATTRLPGARHFGPFDLAVQAGERVAIVGPSGAGKSTLLRLLAGDALVRDGQVQIDGRALSEWPRLQLAARRAVLPQSHGVAFGMPVELVVALGRIAREPDPAQVHIVAQALAGAQAAHLLGRRFDTLSGGEQARVMLARVFAQLWDSAPGWLLVDEPLSALDPGLQLELTDTLLGFCATRGHALVAVLHDLNLALAHFDRLWLVQAGQLVADRPAHAETVPALEQLFGIRLHCVDDGQGRPAVLLQRRLPAARVAAAALAA